jgi:hypothetical protein
MYKMYIYLIPRLHISLLKKEKDSERDQVQSQI